MATIPDKANRRELCEIICTQKEKLQRYEARLGDLVRAYKGLQKEKDALELSLKALAASKGSDKARSSSGECLAAKDAAGNAPSGASSAPDDGQGGESSTSDAGQGDASGDQVAALSQALSTLAEEKARTEAAFQADRKRLIQGKEAALRQLEDAQAKAAEQAAAWEAKMAELRSKLREEQCGRQQEQSDHAAMLRELQRLLSEERTLKENLEDKLEEATRKAAQADLAKEYEAKVEKLTQELEEVRKRLLASEEKLRQPSPLLLKLQQELVEVKAQHQAALEQEQRQSGNAQARLHQQTTGSEARVASLESRLQELSQAVGTYDRLRMQDRAAIQRLRERLSQLAQENAALASAAGIAAKATELPSSQDSNLDVKTLLDRFGKMRLLLKEFNQRAEKPVDLIAYFRELAEEEVLGLHAKCREELRQLKDEFEQYKAHANSSLHGADNQHGFPQEQGAAECERLRKQLRELQGQLRTQRARFEAQEQASREATLKLQRALSEADMRHELECQRLEQRWGSKLSELESLMQAQRDRSLALVEDKDRELQALRATLASLSHQGGDSRAPFEGPPQRYHWQEAEQLHRGGASGVADNNPGSQDACSEGQGDSLDPLLSQLLSRSLGHFTKDGKGKAPPEECQLLHFAQELARKDAELLRTLREKRDVEAALRDLQRSVLLREQRDAQEREALRLRLSQLESLPPGPGDSGRVNLQYLKNVVLQYLLCSEAPARRHMLNAIIVGLRFSPREAQLVRQTARAWW